MVRAGISARASAVRCGVDAFKADSHVQPLSGRAILVWCRVELEAAGMLGVDAHPTAMTARS